MDDKDARIAALEVELADERERREAAEAALRDIQYSLPIGMWPRAMIEAHFARYKD